jgi:hypothetical protein
MRGEALDGRHGRPCGGEQIEDLFEQLAAGDGEPVRGHRTLGVLIAQRQRLLESLMDLRRDATPRISSRSATGRAYRCWTAPTSWRPRCQSSECWWLGRFSDVMYVGTRRSKLKSRLCQKWDIPPKPWANTATYEDVPTNTCSGKSLTWTERGHVKSVNAQRVNSQPGRFATKSPAR